MNPNLDDLISVFVKKCINLEIAEIEGKGKGLRSLEKCDPGTVLLEVPLSKVIDENFIRDFREKDKTFASIATSEEWDAMAFRKQALFIICYFKWLHEKQKDWNLYLSTFPSYVGTPVQWSENQIQDLQGTSLFMPVIAKRKFLTEEWEELKSTHVNLWPSEISLSDWIHADALYSSRCLESPSGSTVLAPVVDLCNHSNEANSKWDFTSDSLQVYAEKALSVGDEITFNYGASKGAAEFLFSYGFIPNNVEGNRTDVLKLLIPNDTNDPLDKFKRKCCNRPPMIEIASDSTGIWWHAPYLYFSVLNYDDFTCFHLQETENGGTELHWEFEGQTTTIEELPDLIQKSPLKDLYLLRVFCLVQQLVEAALKRINDNESNISSSDYAATNLLLRERNLLQKVMPYIQDFIEEFAQSEVVCNHLNAQGTEEEL
ncbi:lysine methyltransferase Set8 [Schizosaccharomyces octosporus yFS286]|uniref:Lysine methyltransferase Set8 n=1 Tax=Schizosaccharomyces octosporus (strain yFS286) TaxID=483514 RepID=S9PSX1_SCHOY|nr:lysine methyltransferase Set8 [Schizosaccharomyces octosporus yFS286]EPX70578.1 lysine methyltransferase Set8 [Schizosaccharomyces octosporus yFS286]